MGILLPSLPTFVCQLKKLILPYFSISVLIDFTDQFLWAYQQVRETQLASWAWAYYLLFCPLLSFYKIVSEWVSESVSESVTFVFQGLAEQSSASQKKALKQVFGARRLHSHDNLTKANHPVLSWTFECDGKTPNIAVTYHTGCEHYTAAGTHYNS